MKDINKGLIFFAMMILLGLLSLAFIMKYKKTGSILIRKKTETISSIEDRLSDEVLARLMPNLDNVGLTTFPNSLILVGLKEEQILEVYTTTDKDVRLIKSYPFTGFSGQLGPKLQEGDLQIPEGIYGVEYINPNSLFYLSIKVSYPNAYDKRVSTLPNVKDMGGDIFIHGKDKTIGCIPIGDEAIEEVFLLVSKAGIKNVKIIISPRDFRVNTQFPSIDHLDWTDDLYEDIQIALLELSS